MTLTLQSWKGSLVVPGLLGLLGNRTAFRTAIRAPLIIFTRCRNVVQTSHATQLFWGLVDGAGYAKLFDTLNIAKLMWTFSEHHIAYSGEVKHKLQCERPAMNETVADTAIVLRFRCRHRSR